MTERDLMLIIIQPTLQLVKAILGRLIEARGVKFQDTSALQPLFKTFTVICSVPLDSELITEVCIFLSTPFLINLFAEFKYLNAL